jgi:hypothetical protein
MLPASILEHQARNAGRCVIVEVRGVRSRVETGAGRAGRAV